MKNTSKVFASSLIIASMCLSMTGCSFGAAKELKEIGTTFIENSLDKKFKKASDVCTDDDEALDMFGPYAAEYAPVDLLLDRATVTAGKASVKKDQGSVEFTITIPNYDAVLDEDPEDIDEYEDLLDEVSDTVDIAVTLEFKNKRDEWLIDNYDDFIEDLFEELYDIDFGFQSEYEGWIDHENWWGSSNGVYDTDRYYIDLDVTIVDEHYYDDMTFTWKCFKGGDLIYTSGTINDYGFLEQYCYMSDSSLSGEYFPSGNYTIVLYDSNDVEFYRSTCEVR